MTKYSRYGNRMRTMVAMAIAGSANPAAISHGERCRSMPAAMALDSSNVYSRQLPRPRTTSDTGVASCTLSSRALVRRVAKAALGWTSRLVIHQTETIVHNDAMRPNGIMASRQPTSFVATVA